MFCFKCGSRQADDAKFCGACGARLAGTFGPQPEAAVSASTAPSDAGVPTSRGAAAADPNLTVEEWNVTCAPPDSNGDVRVEAKVRGEYRGGDSAHLARLSWILFDPSGSVPLLQGENALNQDIDNEDTVEVEAGGFGKLGEGVEPGACQVKGQIVLYPGERQPPWTIPLPEGGQTGGKGPAWRHAGAEVMGWRLACSESSEESATYTLFILVRNTNTEPVAAVTFRVRVKNRKDDVWSTEHLAIQRLAPGGMRSVETTLFVSEHARARRAAFVELTGIVCPVELVQPLVEIVPTISVEAAAEDEGAASAGGLDLNDDDEDTANGSGLTIWEPKGGGPGIWTFYPNAKLRNDYPDCDRDRTGLDCQRGEVLSLIPETTGRRGNTLVVNIAQGRVELRDFDRCWEELRRPPDEDCVVWDIYRIVEEWSSE